MAEEILDSGKARASSIDSFSIISNKDGSIDINSAVIELRYYESIRESTIRVSVSFVDTGNSVKDKSVLEGLPLVGTEKAVIKMKDTNKNKLEVTLYVNSVDPIVEDRKSVV